MLDVPARRAHADVLLLASVMDLSRNELKAQILLCDSFTDCSTFVATNVDYPALGSQFQFSVLGTMVPGTDRFVTVVFDQQTIATATSMIDCCSYCIPNNMTA